MEFLSKRRGDWFSSHGDNERVRRLLARQLVFGCQESRSAVDLRKWSKNHGRLKGANLCDESSRTNIEICREKHI